MIKPKDVEIIRDVYRIQRLLRPHDAAVENTTRLCDWITREEVLAVAQEEDQRRKPLLAERDRIEKELIQL